MKKKEATSNWRSRADGKITYECNRSTLFWRATIQKLQFYCLFFDRTEGCASITLLWSLLIFWSTALVFYSLLFLERLHSWRTCVNWRRQHVLLCTWFVSAGDSCFSKTKKHKKKSNFEKFINLWHKKSFNIRWNMGSTE